MNAVNTREQIFGAVGRQMWELGWSILPQQKDDRKPGVVNEQIIEWNSKYQISERKIDATNLELWLQQCWFNNVAVAMGKGSGYVIAVDIDVTNEKVCNHIQDLAEQFLGYTAYQRVGKAPKIALLYRYDPADPIGTVKRVFGEGVANKDDGLEIQSDGKLMTFHGIHHTTGRYYSWLDKSPLTGGPDDVPIVTSVQMAAFLDAVDHIYPFHRGAGVEYSPENWNWNNESREGVSRVKTAGGGIAWEENEDGLVVDGREAFLTNIAFRHVTGDGFRLDEIRNNHIALGNFVQEKTLTVVAEFKERALIERCSRWDRGLQNEARSKVERVVKSVLSGRVQLKKQDKIAENEDIIAKITARDINDPELAFLPKSLSDNVAITKRNAFRGLHYEERNDPATLALQPDRTEIAEIVKNGLEAAYAAFTDDVYNPKDKYPVHIVYAPTGAGKTSRTMQMLAADPRTKEPVMMLTEHGYEEKQVPYVMLIPTYDNINELRHRAQTLNLDPDASDEELRVQAAEMGLIQIDALDSALNDLRREAINAGLVTMVYKGKIAAGCQQDEKVKMAMSASMGTAGFCKSMVQRSETEKEEVFCEFYHGCPAIAQRHTIQQSHIVFIPHAFMSLSIPEELQEVRGVIVDERIHHMFLHSAVFDLETLKIPRKKPRLSKREKDNGFNSEDLLVDRNEAVEIVIQAFKDKICPAKALSEYTREATRVTKLRNREIRETETVFEGVKLVESAKRVCSSAIQKDAMINPEMSLEEIEEICAQPTGYQVREEYRFWTIIQERMQQLMEDKLVRERIEIIETSEMESADPEKAEKLEDELNRLYGMLRAKGERDYRIQFVIDERSNGHKIERVRISWRTEPNWVERPLMLLDASAAPDIISKVWKSRDIIKHDVPAPLNMKIVGIVDRTYANISMLGHPGMPDLEKLKCSQTVADIRRAISTVCSLYGDGRVVFGTSMCLRKLINTGWVAPNNMDQTHYGALRGLDFAKNHRAAFALSRLLPPVRAIDGIVAATTYDDDAPEEPFDRLGTGKDEKGNPLLVPTGMQKLKMRNGSVIGVPTPMYPGRWARMFQEQYCEQEILQFVGRVRPVYRTGEAPVCFIVASVIPESLIVDDLISLKDLIPIETNVWEAARRSGGVVSINALTYFSPDLFKTAEYARKMLENLAKEPRNFKGFIGYECVDKKGNLVDDGYVMSGLPHIEEAIVAAVSKFTPEDFTVRLLGERSNHKGRARDPDKVDQIIGTLDERIFKEEEIRNEAAYQVFLHSNVEPSLLGGPDRIVPVAKDGSEKMRLTYADIDAMVAIEEYWKINNRDHNDAIAGTVLDDNQENFEKVGDQLEFVEYDIPVMVMR